jgi:hypothetical protein
MESEIFHPKASNPQQIYEIVGDLIFSSCFDSGNLAKVSKRGPNYVENIKNIIKLFISI